MKLLLYKIRKYKARYISIVLALMVIQAILFFAIHFTLDSKARLFPELAFNKKGLYQLKIFFPHPNTQPELVNLHINAEILNQLKNIEGIENCCIGFGSSLFVKGRQGRSLKTNLDSTLKVFYSHGAYGIQNVLPLELVKGSFYTSLDPAKKEVILSETLARKLKLFNKSLPCTVSLPTPYVDNEWQDFSLCGIIKDIGYYNFRNKEEAVFPLLVKPSTNSSALLKLNPNTNLSEVENTIRQVVLPYVHGTSPIIEILNNNSWGRKRWEEDKNQIIPIISIVPTILFYTFIALFGLFWNDVKHKKTDYGIMRAIGFNRTNILKIVLFEALFLALVSALVNLLILLNMHSQILNLFQSMHSNIGNYTMWLITTLCIIALVLLASIIPAIRTTKIQPAEALSDE